MGAAFHWEKGMESPKTPSVDRAPTSPDPKSHPAATPRDPKARRCPPEGRMREGVMCQVAGVVVGGGGGRVEAEGRQGGHAEILGRVVGTEAPQVILGHRTGRHHVVHRPLQAGGQADGHRPSLSPWGDVTSPRWDQSSQGTPASCNPPRPFRADSLERREAGVLDHGAGGQPEGVGCPQEVGGHSGTPRFLLRQGGLRDEALAAGAAAAASRPCFLLGGKGAGTPRWALGDGRGWGIPAVSPP